MTATGILSVPDTPVVHTPTLPSDPVARISAVAFDVGETLIDESRIWLRWADRLGVPPLTMLGVVGAMAALDRLLVEAFQVLRPGLDLDAEIVRWRADDPAGLRENFDADDLYGDVRACFAALGDAGLRLIIAGNQPPQALAALELMDLGADAILISAVLGVEKPSPDFFAAIAAAAGSPPREIAYVGDRLDNDVLPARQAGMCAVLLRRGPWGYLHAQRPDAALADVVADSLRDLPDLLAQLT
jgi:HAD superfamily hydrolase (TIGR01549 family)